MEKQTAKSRRQNVGQVVKSILASRVERKRFSLVTAAAATTTAGLVVPLTQSLLIGDTISGRDGDVITPQLLELNMSLVCNVGVNAATITRVIIFQDRQNNGVAPVPGDLLDGAVYDSSYTLYPNQQRRYKIMHDKVYNSVFAANNQCQMDKIKLKMKGKIFYNGDTNVVGANGPGSIWILVIANNTFVNYTYYSSLVFTDM